VKVQNLEDALMLLGAARTPEQLFGPSRAGAGRMYRRMARLLHPDATAGRTADEFTRLNALWRAYNGAGASTVTARRHVYELGAEIARGDLANLYAARYDGARRAVVKMPRDPGDSDLIEREAVALRQLPKDGEGRFLPYVPRLIETFRHRDQATGAQRRANAIVRLDGFHSLAEVRAAHPDGLDPRDAAWMWRRLLVALGFAHRAGVLHGAVLPEHVLIHPEQHGLVLVDWCYSVPGCYASTDPSGRVPAMVDRYADWYPDEVPRRRPAGPATDIHMATRCMSHLMADKAPKALRLFAKGCTLSAQNRRPSDAWRLLRELDELLERLYGPRRFRPFHMPTVS
jgi:hypothetical protein